MSAALTFLRTSLARFHCACDAMAINSEDVRLEDFTPSAQARWFARADQEIRTFINRESPADAPRRAGKRRIHR